MSLCAFCGQVTLGGGALCTHHTSGHEDDWATSNRIMCNFVHRGVVPPERGESYMELLLGRLEGAFRE